MFEARVEMRLKPKLDNHWIMVTINVGVDSVKPLEKLADESWECFWKGDA